MTRARRLGRATFASLRNRNYRLYFIGQIISVSGTWMQRLAQAWLILRLTHNNGFALGVESGLQFLPVLLFGAWGGVIADRFDKRRLLYLTQIGAGLLALGLGLIVAAGGATVLLVYVFSVLSRFRERDRQPCAPDLRDGDGRPGRIAERCGAQQRGHE
jgi:MFS family permease